MRENYHLYSNPKKIATEENLCLFILELFYMTPAKSGGDNTTELLCNKPESKQCSQLCFHSTGRPLVRFSACMQSVRVIVTILSMFVVPPPPLTNSPCDPM